MTTRKRKGTGPVSSKLKQTVDYYVLNPLHVSQISSRLHPMIANEFNHLYDMSNFDPHFNTEFTKILNELKQLLDKHNGELDDKTVLTAVENLTHMMSRQPNHARITDKVDLINKYNKESQNLAFFTSVIIQRHEAKTWRKIMMMLIDPLYNKIKEFEASGTPTSRIEDFVKHTISKYADDKREEDSSISVGRYFDNRIRDAQSRSTAQAASSQAQIQPSAPSASTRATKTAMWAPSGTYRKRAVEPELSDLHDMTARQLNTHPRVITDASSSQMSADELRAFNASRFF